ncbi:MAG: BLUF domain-containing protein [Verrucomicrobiota bacterium]
MHSLLYSSVARYQMSKEDLLSLLNHSRENNIQSGITGMLIYNEQLFMQVLEGSKETIKSLYENKIKKDTRHTLVSLYLFEPIEAREFEDWSMAFHDLRDYDLKQVEGYSTFLQTGFTQESIYKNLSVAKELLVLFRDYDTSKKFA